MTKVRGIHLMFLLSIIVLIIAYCTQPLPTVQAQSEGTPTPQCGFDSAGNWVCISHTNDLTVTPTETDWYTESPTAIPTGTNTRRPTATATAISLTPFVPTDTPTPVANTPTVTPTIVIQPWKRQLFLPVAFR